MAPSTPDKGDAVLVAGHPHTVEGFTRQDGTNGLSNEIIADHLGASVLLRDRRHHQGREGQHQRMRDAGGRRDTHAPPPRSAIPRYRRKGSGEAMVTKTVQTWQLRAGWIVIPQTGSPRRVLNVRLDGAHPVAHVEFAGIPNRITYPAAQILTVHDAR